VDGVGLVEDGVEADCFLEYEGCVVEGLEYGGDWEGAVVVGVARCGGRVDRVA
jgi:hypothetical protein